MTNAAPEQGSSAFSNHDAAQEPLPPAAGKASLLQKVAVLGIALALTGTMSTVIWAELQRRPASETVALQTTPEAALDLTEPATTVVETATPADQENEEATQLRAEVERLLRLADSLDAQIDRLAAETRRPYQTEPSPGASELPEAETLVATGPAAVQGSDLPAAPALPDLQAPAAQLPLEAASLLPAAPVQFQVSAGTEAASLVMPQSQALLAHPPAEAALAGAEHVPLVLADLQAMTTASAVPAETKSRPPAAILAATSARPSAAQRRCQFITLRFQLGEEPSHADQRFLRKGCR
jgi:hypothetical protein